MTKPIRPAPVGLAAQLKLAAAAQQAEDRKARQPGVPPR
jgi:hypothetical protein